MATIRAADADKNHVHAAVVLTPKAGLIDEACAHLGKFAEQVEANEPDTLVFSVAKSVPIKELGEEGPEQIVLTTVFKSKAALEAHKSSPYYLAAMEALKSSDKLAAPPQARSLTPTAGFLRKPPQ